MKNIFTHTLPGLLFLVCVSACQKMERPVLGDYPTDKNQTLLSGNLRFYVGFNKTDGITPRWNAYDSISNNPAMLCPLQFIDGANGKAVQGEDDKYIQYLNVNDFLSTAQSFTVAFWEKRDGAPPKNAEFPFSFPASNGHWTNTQMFLLFDHKEGSATDNLAVLKFLIVDKDMHDVWLAWEKNQDQGYDHRVPNIQDNKWHHLAFVYNATNSSLSLYVDGVKNSYAPTWGSHGAANMDGNKSKGLYIGGRPSSIDWGKSWQGALDQFRLYNTALSEAEISALYAGRQ